MPQQSSPVAKAVHAPAARITVIYLVAFSAWIVLSDRLCLALTSDPSALNRLSTVKGCLSVALSAAILHYLVFRKQEQSRRLLAANEDHYRAIFELAEVGVALVDGESGRFLEVNRKYCDIVGYRACELLERTFRDITPPEELPHDQEQVARFAAGGGEAVSWEKRYRQRDGRIIPVRITLSSIPGDNQVPPVRLAVVHDVSAAKEAEAALREAKERLAGSVLERTAELERAERSIVELNGQLERRVEELQLLLDTAPIGLAITREPGARAIRGNPALERLLGVSSDTELSFAATERPPFRVMRDGALLPVGELPMQRAARGERVTGESLEIVRPDGSAVHVYACASPVFGDGGECTGAVGAFMDITARTHAEEELRLHRDHLDTLVRERAAELAARNAQLAVEIEERTAAQRIKTATITLLRLCNEAETTARMVSDLVGFFKGYTGVEGVAIRLQEHGDFPYCAAEGFAPEVCDEGGTPRSAGRCSFLPAGTSSLSSPLCQMILSGAPRGELASLFTPSGTFWAGALPTLSPPAVEGPPAVHRCLRCGTHGYRSIALIPLCWRGDVFGLLQLSDRREGAFGAEEVALAETLVSHAAIALAKLRSDEALHESARALREAQQIARVGSYRYDYASDRWTSSETLDAIYGIDAGFQRDADGWYTLVHPDDRAPLYSYAAEMKARRDRFNRAFRIVRRCDGAVRWVHLVAELEYAADGRPLRVLGTVQDVTERKRGEEALKASERRFRTLIQQAPVAIGIFRRAQTVYANGKLLEMFGFESLDDIRGRSVGLLMAPHCREEVIRRALLRLEGGPVPSEYETVAWRRGEGAFPVQVAATPVQLADGIATIAFFYDVTERKRAEEAVRCYTRRLMELEEELRKRIASELHDDIGQELTALGLNLCYIGNALEGALPELSQRLEDSRQIARDISRSVRNLMNELRPPLLDELGLAAALSFQADLFHSRTGIPVALDAPDDFPPLPVQTETALFRIAQEALTNVAKHARPRCVAISLSTEGDTVRLVVADDGAGFLPGAVPAAAESGWGLTVMRERAALVGASFTVESAPGRGTKIVIEAGKERQ